MILEKGEKVHIIERRYFAEDVKRHFCGEVIEFSEGLLRAIGNIWVLDNRINKFIKRDTMRERIFCLGDRLTINILPKNIDSDRIQYVYDEEKGLLLTDDATFAININEFGVIG